jgi:hypothetical protein
MAAMLSGLGGVRKVLCGVAERVDVLTMRDGDSNVACCSRGGFASPFCDDDLRRPFAGVERM